MLKPQRGSPRELRAKTPAGEPRLAGAAGLAAGAQGRRKHAELGHRRRMRDRRPGWHRPRRSQGQLAGARGRRQPLAADASTRAIENHERIATAIDKAYCGWREIDDGVDISRDRNYQLANRLAVTWKLAQLGIPVVLLYLGFTGDTGIIDAGSPFLDEADWQAAFDRYAGDVGAAKLFGVRHEIRETPVWLLSRGRPVIEISSPRHAASAAKASHNLGKP